MDQVADIIIDHMNKTQIGMPTDQYVKQISPYLPVNENRNYVMPKVNDDFKRFLELYAWPKKLLQDNIVNIYPLLLLNLQPFMEEQPFIEFYADQSQQTELHWHFILEINKAKPNSNDTNKYPIELMIKNYFHGDKITTSLEYDHYSHNLKRATATCQQFWNELMTHFENNL